MKVDKDDNIWVADKGSDMVIKFNPEGRVAMVFGRKQEASDEGTEPLKHPKPPLPPVDGMFRQVTDMAWDAAGNTYISDGYINSRVAKIDKNGNWLKSWGEPGDEPGTVQHAAQHCRGRARAMSMWRTAATGASRYSTATASSCARSRSTCPSIRTPVRRSATSRTCAHRASTWRPARPGRSASRRDRTRCCSAPMPIPAAIYKLTLDGKVLGVLGESGKQPRQFGWIHEIACPSENELYVAELLNWRVQKLILKPGR